MTKHALFCVPALLLLSACASQTAEQQMGQRSQVVRVCQGASCIDQHKDTVTFQAPQGNPEQEHRLAELSALAENNPRAAYDLGLRLLRGDGVERDSSQAIEWMRKAGDMGFVEAQFALGRLYLHGFEEMGSDPAEAEAWLTRAAAKGKKQAEPLLKEAQKAKQRIHDNYQIQEAERQAWGQWYRTAPYYWTWGSRGWYLR